MNLVSPDCAGTARMLWASASSTGSRRPSLKLGTHSMMGGGTAEDPRVVAAGAAGAGYSFFASVTREKWITVTASSAVTVRR